MEHSSWVCSQSPRAPLQNSLDVLKLDAGQSEQLMVRYLDRSPYETIFRKMQAFTFARTPETVDECWVLEHDPVFTQGQAGKLEHLLDVGEIPVVQTDRGGQVTYHGPGQLILYTLIDIQRKKLSIKDLVSALEQAAIDTLKNYDIEASTKPGAPGVYVNEAKICSLGLKIRKGCSYHGLSFNVDMDLQPFSRIRPCGLSGIKMTQLRDVVERDSVEAASLTEVSSLLINCLARQLNYQKLIINV